MQIFFGIDWSHTHHDACFLDERGHVLGRVTVEHTADGLAKLDRAREQLGVTRAECQVGLETAPTLLIDSPLASGIRGIDRSSSFPLGRVRARGGVTARRMPIPIKAMRSLRSNAIIADVLRTDPDTLHPWRPDGLLVRQLRAKVSFLHFLTKEIRRLSNRLQALLARYYPAALHVFYDPASPISLLFLQAFPTPAQAATLTRQAFGHACVRGANRYTCPTAGAGRQSDAVLSAAYARLQTAYPIASATTVAAYRDEAVWLAQHLLATLEHKKAGIARLQELFQQHPDQELFASLPGTGDSAKRRPGVVGQVR